MTMQAMRSLRDEARKLGVRPARSKAATIARIEEAYRVKGILSVRRITQEALRVLHEKFARFEPPTFTAAKQSGGPIRIRLPSKPEAVS